MKLTKKHQEKIWGESGPYSQVNLKIENRILDDAVSRIFVIVETELNPFTFELIKKNSEKFKNDKMIQGTGIKADHSIHVCNSASEMIQKINALASLDFDSVLITERKLQADIFSNQKNTELLLEYIEKQSTKH